MERKIAKAQFVTGQSEVNDDYFANSLESQGIEIHITSDVNADEHATLKSIGAAHQSLFLRRSDPLTRSELLDMLDGYRATAKKCYVEAVLYDSNPDLDAQWHSA